jgi:Glycosyltransferase family 87
VVRKLKVSGSTQPTGRQLDIAAWTLIGLYLLGLAISAASRSQSDFIIYRNSGIQAAHAGQIYNFRDPSPFQYAPIFAVAFIPLGLLPSRAAQLLWFMISMVLALPAMILGTSRLLFGRGFELRWELIVVPVLLCVRFIQPNFDHGQINLLLMAVVVWGLALANERRSTAGGALLAASLLLKPFSVPVILYLFGRRHVRFIISLFFFAVALLWLPSLFVGARYTFHETAEYIRSLTIRVPHLSHDLYNKYNQSAAAIAVRLFASTKQRSGLLSQNVAATTGFAFQCALTIAIIVWSVLRRSSATEQNARLSLAALFCIAAAFSPVSWLEYYMALEVPYMALVFIARSSEQGDQGRARAAQFVLAGSLIVNLGTRFFEPALYYGATYFASLIVLIAVMILTGTKASLPGSRPFASLTSSGMAVKSKLSRLLTAGNLASLIRRSTVRRSRSIISSSARRSR